MKNIILIPFILLIGFLITSTLFKSHFLDQYIYYSYCDKPISYQINTVDPKFNLSKDEFIRNSQEAASIWNNVSGKNLFAYDPQGSLSVNLIFDERQSLHNQIVSLENQLKTDKGEIKPQIEEYEKGVADFKERLRKLNDEIRNWNSRGGAPPDVYERLIKQQQDLKADADRLNKLGKSLNRSTDLYNTQVQELNQTIIEFNVDLQYKPEEGIYKANENRIEIYFNINRRELVHTLAHEMGHARGLNHIENPTSIMFSKTTQLLEPSTNDIQALEEICKNHNKLEDFKNNLLHSYN